MQADSTSAPLVEGDVRNVCGRISFLGKSFEPTSGQVSSTGARGIDPDLAAVAEHRGATLEVNVEASGSLSQPRLALSSSPELLQDGTVARLLFRKRTVELAPLKAVQLAAALAELSGGADPTAGLLNRLGELIGADVLRIGGERTGGPR